MSDWEWKQLTEAELASWKLELADCMDTERRELLLRGIPLLETILRLDRERQPCGMYREEIALLSVKEVVEVILKDHPLGRTTKELARAMVELGYYSDYKQAYPSLCSALTRNKLLFHRIARSTYLLAPKEIIRGI